MAQRKQLATPIVKTQSPLDSSDKAASTKYVDDAVTAAGGGSVDFMSWLTADAAGNNNNSLQDWLPGVTKPTYANGLYIFQAQLTATKSAGATSHSTDSQLNGTAVLGTLRFNWVGMYRSGVAGWPVFNVLSGGTPINGQSNLGGSNFQSGQTGDTATTSIFGASIYNGFVQITTPGTFFPQLIFSAAPGGAPTFKKGSYFYMRKVG